MALEEYRRKRKFAKTPEPPARVEKTQEQKPHFVVQMHHATRLHYDFRLEMEAVLKSWAVPKGPTLDPGEKRLAMMVEDHPLDYMHFEGIIPAGNYGAGTVMVWDTGTWEPLGDPAEMLEKGDLKFVLHGKKLSGEFALVHMKSRRAGSRGNEWLLIKKKDASAQPGWDPAEFDWSVLTRRSLEQIAADEASGTWQSDRKAEPRGRVRLRAANPVQDLKRAKHAAAQRTIEMERDRKAKESPKSKVESPKSAEKSPRSKVQSPRSAGIDPSKLPGAVKAAMPEQLPPMLATLVKEPEEGADWLYEIKWDGVRAIAFLDDGRVRLQSRSLRDITACYPDLAGIARAFNAGRAVFDGEIVVLDEEGRSSFARLQQRMNVVPDQRLMAQYPVVYYVFDLLYLDGYDLRRVPLENRKEALRAILIPGANDRARYSGEQIDHGKELAELAAARQLEGIIGKRHDSLYESRRSRAWLKVKTVQEAEAIIGGYTEPRGSRPYFGSLVLGVEQDGKLVHVGNAGSGFTAASQKQVWEKLKALRTEKSPFVGKPRTPQRAHWVEPELRARVKFVEWTNEHKMRAPVVLEVFDPRERKTLAADPAVEPQPVKEPTEARTLKSGGRQRRDRQGAHATQAAARSLKRATSVAPREPGGFRKAGKIDTLFSGDASTQTVTVDGRTLEIRNLNKVFFPKDGYTKRDVIEYYYRIADYLLPYMKDRPLTLKRYPDGIQAPFFYQKNAREAVPDWVPTVRIRTEHGHSRFIDQATCNDRATLVYLANLGCIDHHIWLSRAGSLDHPDFVLFDLDPGERVSFDQLLEVALNVKEKLDQLGLAGYPKTSGATGMHIWVPVDGHYTYEDTRNFAQLVYDLALPDVRKLVTFERSLSKRPKDRVYLDYVQNAIAKSVPPPYSLRPHDGAPVSTPLAWKEVKKGLDPGEFNIQTIWKRLEKTGDLYREVLENRQRLEPALELAQELTTPQRRRA